MKGTHHRIRVVGIRLGYHDVQAPPYVIFELPNVDTLCPFGIVHKFRLDTPCLPLRRSEEILLAGLSARRQVATVAIEAVVEARAVIVIFMEELGVEWNGTSVRSYEERSVVRHIAGFHRMEGKEVVRI